MLWQSTVKVQMADVCKCGDFQLSSDQQVMQGWAGCQACRFPPPLRSPRDAAPLLVEDTANVPAVTRLYEGFHKWGCHVAEKLII